jgi:hypothetical protein
MALPWEERLREAAYTGPDGTRVEFLYADVSKTIRKKTTAHEFPDVGATFVEDKGLKGSLYPLRVFFSGSNHDVEADAFEAVLNQRGPGTLHHPKYGVKTAIPFGDIVRSEKLATAANVTTFTVTFWETLAALYPSADTDTLQLVDAAVEDYDNTGAAQFAASVETANPGERAGFTAGMRQLKDGATSALRKAQDGTGALQSRMNKIDKAINSTLETFVGGPLTLAFQLRQLVGAPARSLALLRDRLDAYGNLAESIIAGNGTGSGGGTGSSGSTGAAGIVDPGTGAPGAISDANNTFHANRVVAEVSVLGFALAVSGQTYTTRSQALDSAKELADVFSDVVDWSEANYDVLFAASPGPDATRPAASGVGSLDTGEGRQALLRVVTLTLQYLIATAFTLGIEKTFILATPRTAIDLVAELYGGLDELDSFMDANQFTGDQILEIPAGTLVRYYAE